MNPWLTIPSAPHLEKSIAEEIRTLLQETQAESCKSPVSPLRATDKIRFQVLHRQFSKGGMFGLPSAVWAARTLLSAWRSATPRLSQTQRHKK